MQLKSVIVASLLAGAASALPAAHGISARALCTPKDNTGFTVRINSTDELNGKILGISGDTVGVDLPSTDSVIWPYTNGKSLKMPGPGYKYLLSGYLIPTSDNAGGEQLMFSEAVPAVPVGLGVFTTSCDLQGFFYLAVEYSWQWQVCPVVVGGEGWTVHRGATREGCRDVRLRMSYGPPY
ncbi:hypothetical protein DRE_02708 [Drechslerella stenobrocha 248]|uniref:Uncharacterized protein n=1 Tax=Drechslerella stenobrocha 248 TaxID=1043628 RepID=W7HX70_9PEZI|nr:hypothetical protein DRE_02708 [Drechslerella stenobrocha 248]